MSKRMFFKSYTPNPVSKAVRTEDDPIVQNGLAVTPAEMNQMLQAGLPISAQINSMFNDDTLVSARDFSVDAIYQRGIDAAEIFEMQQGAKRKIKDAFQHAERQPIQEGGN